MDDGGRSKGHRRDGQSQFRSSGPAITAPLGLFCESERVVMSESEVTERPEDRQKQEVPEGNEQVEGREESAQAAEGLFPEAPEEEPEPSLAEASRLKSILEALIFCSDAPVSMEKLSSLVDGSNRREIKAALDALVREYRERQGALEIVEVANGYQVRTRPEMAPWVARLRQQRPARLSRAALEVAAIVAYRQPATRAEIEAVRGVDCAAALGTLLEKRLVRVVGRKEVPGRPILYGTTQEFLELFGLKNLKSLPTLREIEGMIQKAQPELQEAPAEGAPAAEERVGQLPLDSSAEAVAAEAGEVRPDPEPVYAGDGPGEACVEEGEDEEEIPAVGPESLDDIALRDAMDDILKRTKTRLVRYEEVVQEPQDREEGAAGGGEEEAGGEGSRERSGEGSGEEVG